MNAIKAGLVALALAAMLAACSPAVDNQVAAVIEQKANQEAAIVEKLQAQVTAERARAQEAQSRAQATAAWARSESALAETWQSRWGVVVWLVIGGATAAAVGAGVLTGMIGNMTVRRMQLQFFGPNKNPIVLLPNGAIYQPIGDIWSMDEKPPELAAQLAAGYQAILAAQAQHAPFPQHKPAEVAKSREWQIGPIASKSSDVPIVERIPVPALPRVEPAPQLAAGKDKMHMIFVEGGNISPEEKKLFDLRELVEGADIRGLTRDKWQGHKFSTGNECTQGYHRELVEILVAANVVSAKGKTHVMRVPTDQAIEALSLQSYDYR